MPVIYRTDGGWGSGKGANLTPAEVDGNFWDIDTRVTSIEDNPVEPVTPIAINIEGSAFTMGLSNGDTLGPITLTMPMPTWRGAWNATLAYNELDFFTSPDNGLGAVMIPHTSAATFDWGALDPGGTGLPVYRQLIGGSGTTSGISDLVDVALGTQAADDMLVWDAPASLWRNETPAAVNTILPAFGGSTGSTAGLKGLVPAPAAGDATAGKVLGAGGGWVVPAGGSGGSSSLAGLADVAIVSPLNLSLLQYSSVDGKWHNQTLATLGTGTVTHVDTGAGLIGGPITGTGSISLEPIPTLDLLANVTGATAPAAGVSLSTLLDAVLGTARGSVMWRSATGWVALTAGTAGQFLRTGGTGADVTWGTPAGAGTVTQVNSGTGLTGGPITATGTLSLATVSDNQVLANISGGVAAPAGTTLTLLLDHALGATQGMIVYRGAASWTALAPGASGAVLTSGGAAANPSWVTGSGAGTVTNVATGTGLIGGPITGTGTISFATAANQTLLANISGATAAPTPSTMSAIMDAVFASARGSVLYRGAAGWAALGPGAAGQVLTAAGASADPSWAAAAGASISIGDTPPASPTAGAMWWDSVGGQLYLSFNDGTSTQWVPASNQPGPPGTSIPLPVSVANGGTGQTTAGAALTALGGAPLASPVFTGTPSLPTGAVAVTQAPGDNDTSIATTAFVKAQGYAPLASPSFTGNVAVAGSIAVGGNATAVLDIASSNYTGLHAPDNAGLVYLGTAAGGSGASLYRNVIHQFQNVAGSINWGVFDASGLSVGVDFTLSRVDIATGYILRPNTSGFKNLAFGTTGANLLDQATMIATIFQANGSIVVGAPTGGSKGTGTINATGVYANNVLLTSDAALKRDIEPVPECLPLVAAVEPKRFRFIEPVRERERDAEGVPIPESGPPGWFERQRWGLVAQDVEAVMAAAGHDFGGLDIGADGIRSLPVGDLTAVLWQAVRELSARVAALEGDASTPHGRRQ